ncbi:MAG: TIGR00730 family Rossman fold protein [Candidatus Wildermuthbacteria bacterium]|nr:TIGR00730 family Rossman fold protein [Candidatus Wildermuthbacteria bacterium]
MSSNKSGGNIYQGGQICLPPSVIAKLMNLPPEKVSGMRLPRIMEEFAKGFEFLKHYGKSVTFFGSTRSTESSKEYQEARQLAGMFAKEGFAVITGGGPGIMEAANRGATEAGGKSAGINIQLDAVQNVNPFVQESISFHHFFARKVMLAFASEVYIFFPGGFGTLDEFFEITTLVQTRKIESIPVILLGKEYWTPLLSWIEKDLLKKRAAVDAEDVHIYRLAKNIDDAFDTARRLAIRDLVRTA